MDNNKFQQEKIKVYLSYRFKYKKIGNRYRNNVKIKNIELAFDAKEIKEGESITEFMDQLADAGFILILLTRDYFESAYTLHELLLISKRIKENKERLIPEFVRLTDDITMSSITEIVEYWGEHKELRDELRRLQKKKKMRFKMI